MKIPLSPCVPENLVSRDGFSRPVPRQPAHLHTPAESGAYLRDSSRVPGRRPFMKSPYAIGSVPSLSGRAIAYRWRSLPRICRHRASKPQDSSERVLPWQVTINQLIFASLCYTHHWYEVGMLKVPAGYKHSFLSPGLRVLSSPPPILHYFPPLYNVKKPMIMYVAHVNNKNFAVFVSTPEKSDLTNNSSFVKFPRAVAPCNNTLFRRTTVQEPIINTVVSCQFYL